MINRKVIILMALAIISGCTQSKEYSIYNPNNAYEIGNQKPISIPADIKLRKAQSAEYYIKPYNALPTPIPSILPPNSQAIQKEFEKNKDKEDKLDSPYYEKVTQYPMPNSKDSSNVLIAKNDNSSDTSSSTNDNKKSV